MFLVTNRHVADLAWSAPDKQTDPSDRGYDISYLVCIHRAENGVQRRFSIKDPLPFFDNTYSTDVAVIPVKFIVALDGISDVIRIDECIDVQDFASPNDFDKGLWLCDVVAFPGFSEVNRRGHEDPILRVGYLVSNPRKELDLDSVKGDALLIEAFSTDGFSGAPVFSLEIGFAAGTGLTIEGGRGHRPWRLVGVNAGHVESFKHGHAQLSYVFKSTAIERIISKIV